MGIKYEDVFVYSLPLPVKPVGEGDVFTDGRSDPFIPPAAVEVVRRGRPATGAKSAAERKRAERARKKEKGDGILSD